MNCQGNALKTDLYELTMAAGYFQNNMADIKAVFELSCHTMPPNRSYLVSCGLEQIVEYILNLKFSEEDINFIKSIPAFKAVDPSFFEYLKSFKFTGDLWAMPEGEIFFAGEPVIQVVAPLIEAQILETYLLSVLNVETLVATKAARVVQAACLDGKERSVIDFGSRRAHGPQAGILAARAAYIGGCLGTSNVYAGKHFGIPLYGTVAHSWIEAFDSEHAAFKAYFDVFPQNSILLIDTYDTLKAAQEISRLKFKKDIKGVRIDSGNLKILSKKVRQLLNKEGLHQVKIIASGNLNEYKIAELVKAKAPIDIFGVGTDMVTSRDYPALDLTYKLVEIEDGKGNIRFKAKRSQGKKTIPARKQIFRKFTKKCKIERDSLGLFSEALDDTIPLLKPVLEAGKLAQGLPALEEIRKSFKEKVLTLPEACLNTERSHYLKPVLTPRLRQLSNSQG